MIRKILKKYKSTRGFTMLFAVVISIIILSIGLILSVIAVKELTISNTFRESMLAFYASESGSECARYWATNSLSNFPRTAGASFSINCNNQDFTYPGNISDTGSDATHRNYTFEYNPGSFKTNVTVIRDVNSIRNEVIKSEGYNTLTGTGKRAVQRYREINVSGICSLKPDVMLALDVSGSICRSGESGCPDPSEYDQEKNAAKTFVNTFDISSNRSHFGIVSFDTYGRLHLHLTANKSTILGAIDTLPGNNFTNISQGLKRSTYELTHRKIEDHSPESPVPGDFAIQDDNDARNSSPGYIILLTDGAPNYVTSDEGVTTSCGGEPSCDVTNQATIAKSGLYNIGIFVIAVGSALNEPLLKAVSSGPDYYFKVDDFSKLGDAFTQIRNCVTPIIEK